MIHTVAGQVQSQNIFILGFCLRSGDMPSMTHLHIDVQKVYFQHQNTIHVRQTEYHRKSFTHCSVVSHLLFDMSKILMEVQKGEFLSPCLINGKMQETLIV